MMSIHKPGPNRALKKSLIHSAITKISYPKKIRKWLFGIVGAYETFFSKRTYFTPYPFRLCIDNCLSLKGM